MEIVTLIPWDVRGSLFSLLTGGACKAKTSLWLLEYLDIRLVGGPANSLVLILRQGSGESCSKYKSAFIWQMHGDKY